MSHACIIFASCALLVLGCDQVPVEPPAARPVQRAARALALQWEVPATWSLEKRSQRGKYRAKYRVAPQGDDKHPAEMLITKLPSRDSIDSELGRLEAAFEKPPKAATREQISADARSIEITSIEIMETSGTYRMPMGPVIPGSRGKRHAAHVLQSNWRGIAAGVNAGPRGRWFFRLVGPSDTVEAARSPMRNMLENLK
jgi:hypothetical protein